MMNELKSWLDQLGGLLDRHNLSALPTGVLAGLGLVLLLLAWRSKKFFNRLALVVLALVLAGAAVGWQFFRK